MVTRCSSACALIAFSPATQLSVASASLLPRRLPNIAITFGTPWRAASGSVSSSSRNSMRWFARSLKPVAMKSRRAVGYPMEHTRPASRTGSQSSGPSRSMPASPMPAAARANSGNGIWRYGQRETDCLRRPGGRAVRRSVAPVPCSRGSAKPATALAESAIASRRVTDRPSA